MALLPTLSSTREYLKLSLDPATATNTYDNQNIKVDALVDKICDTATLTVTNEDGTSLFSRSYPTLGANFRQQQGFTEYGFAYPASWAVVSRETTFNPANAISSRVIPRIESGLNGSVLGFGNAAALDAFALRVQGEIIAPKSGTYTLSVNSDDGFFITFYDYTSGVNTTFDYWQGNPYWNSNLTVDRLGVPMQVTLSAGERYWYSADFFEWGGDRLFEVRWILPGESTPSFLLPINTGIIRTIDKHEHKIIKVKDAQTITAVLEMKNNDGRIVRKFTKTLAIPDRTPPVIDKIHSDLGFVIKPFDASKLKPGDIIRKANGDILP